MTHRLRLEEAHLADLVHWFPKLVFDRAEQVTALVHSDTADFQAVPGSGKTTLLGAKLALIAKRWPHANRGVCVLSHTNVAKGEIERRLRSVPGGERLLGYPHYIGTIQSFTNKYLALPWLRQKGIDVKEIDDEAFVERFFQRVAGDFAVKPWVAINAWKRGDAIRAIRYEGPDLRLATTSDTALPVSGKCIDRLTAIKGEFAAHGWLRYDDMFAYAEQVLRDVPALAPAIAYRFPWVFIDEMQDTSNLQLNILSKLFEGHTVMQRFGDVNQSILRREKNNHSTAFPRASFFEVSTSLRFGPEVAAVANKLKAVGGDMQGLGSPAVSAPALCLYSDASVEKVVARFGDWVASLFSQDELDALPVKAICAVKKSGNAQQQVGRHLADYFPTFEVDTGRPNTTRKTICALVRDSSMQHSSPDGYAKRVAAARLAVLRLLQVCGDAQAHESPTWAQLNRALAGMPEKLLVLNRLVLDLVKGQWSAGSPAEWATALESMLRALDSLACVGFSARPEDSAELAYEAPVLGAVRGTQNKLPVASNGRRFDVQLSTIAGVKGETHLATLVLEACFNKRFDLRDLLPYLCGKALAQAAADDTARGQLQNLFVAVTRATGLVALAMHCERADATARENLQAQGWQVLDWTV